MCPSVKIIIGPPGMRSVSPLSDTSNRRSGCRFPRCRLCCWFQPVAGFDHCEYQKVFFCNRTGRNTIRNRQPHLLIRFAAPLRRVLQVGTWSSLWTASGLSTSGELSILEHILSPVVCAPPPSSQALSLPSSQPYLCSLAAACCAFHLEALQTSARRPNSNALTRT